MARLVAFFRARFHDVKPPVKRGYVVWSGVGLTIAIPEIWAAFGDPRWPTISGTVGHLETLWDGTAVIVVAVIVVIAANAVRFYALRRWLPGLSRPAALSWVHLSPLPLRKRTSACQLLSPVSSRRTASCSA